MNTARIIIILIISILIYIIFFDNDVEPFNYYDQYLDQYPAGYNLKRYLPFSESYFRTPQSFSCNIYN
jgi:hypothetical protein